MITELLRRMIRKRQPSSPHLWGKWDTDIFMSGTLMIRCAVPHKPLIYVYPDASVDDRRFHLSRLKMTSEITGYLNGGKRPAWLDDFYRVRHHLASSLTGAYIESIGPFVEYGQPNCEEVYRQLDSLDASRDRAAVISFLLKGHTERE